MNWRMHRSYRVPLTARAYNLRREPTTGENRLWAALRELRHSHKLKFRRQQPIGPYIADFYCPALKCIIEVDGLSHENEIQQKKDHMRDAYMKKNGLQVLRFTERDVAENTGQIVETILHLARTPPLAPPSRGGE